jgi:serine/threonine protein kinase
MGAGASAQPADADASEPPVPPATSAIMELGKRLNLTPEELVSLGNEELETLLDEQGIKKRQVLKRAEEIGIDEDLLDEADEADNPKAAILELVRKAAQAEAAAAGAASARSRPATTDDRYEFVSNIQGSSVRLVKHKASDELFVAKTFSESAAFGRELATLKLCKDKVGKGLVIQQKDTHEESLTIYLEHAEGGSLKDRLSKRPGGMTDNEARPWVEKTLKALQYLHTFHKLAHTDLKVENLLIYGEDRDQLRICDMESAAKFGEPRGVRGTPYTCAPEVARHIVAGGGSSLAVDAKEDIWALGVTVLYLLTGQSPFKLGPGDEMAPKVAPLASLTQEAVAEVLRSTGKVPRGSQIESFLLRCLEIDVANRATAEVLSRGWINGDFTTQVIMTNFSDLSERKRTKEI